MHPEIDRIDRLVSRTTERLGHGAHRWGIALFFVWLGLLKVFGQKTTTSLIAHTVYLGEPELMVPLLGWWEVTIGVCLMVRPLVRLAILLLVIRLPGTVMALVLKSDICFAGSPLLPTPEGQYLIKDVVLFSAALLIGGTVRSDRDEPSHDRASEGGGTEKAGKG